MSTIPLQFVWDGEAMSPATAFWARKADEQFVVGERYRMVEENERSTNSHNHEFAWLHEAWTNLPDHMLDQFPSAEHLRKFALIAKGHCLLVQHPCATAAEAERLAAILRPYDAYALVKVRGAVVSVYTAVSQSKRSMGGPEFQRSKQDIIDYVAGLLGVDAETLEKQERAA